MQLDNWSLLVGLGTSVLMGLTPWMISVHVRLAVLGARFAALEGKVDRLLEAHEKRLPQCALHEARLADHADQLKRLSQRVESLA